MCKIVKEHGGNQLKAIERNKELRRKASQLYPHKEVYLVNPTTNVDELVERLLNFGS